MYSIGERRRYREFEIKIVRYIVSLKMFRKGSSEFLTSSFVVCTSIIFLKNTTKCLFGKHPRVSNSFQISTRRYDFEEYFTT